MDAKELINRLVFPSNSDEAIAHHSTDQVLADIEKAGFVLVPLAEIKAAKAKALRGEAEYWREAGRSSLGAAGRTVAMSVAATIELHAIEAED